MSLPPWRTPLARALHRNRSLPNARYLQLATLDLKGHPANRTVVFRGWRDPESQLQFVTDTRSTKIQQIYRCPQVEACWYFPKTCEQFRIGGMLELIDRHSSLEQEHRQLAWQQLSAKARLQFNWPAPLQPRADDTTFSPAPIDAPSPSDNFGLLLLSPQVVDHLELKGDPQNRWIYERSNTAWSKMAVNP
jgi:pyridoxamine 5'-phosphate oxidase